MLGEQMYFEDSKIYFDDSHASGSQCRQSRVMHEELTITESGPPVRVLGIDRPLSGPWKAASEQHAFVSLLNPLQVSADVCGFHHLLQHIAVAKQLAH